MDKNHVTFKDLDAWKNARLLAIEIYKISSVFPSTEIYGLTNQIRRASVSVVSNIAEGYGRASNKERIYFFNIAKSSLNEVETQLILSVDFNFTNNENILKANELITNTSKTIVGFINYLNKIEK